MSNVVANAQTVINVRAMIRTINRLIRMRFLQIYVGNYLRRERAEEMEASRGTVG